jgi:UrcA family protein
MKTLFIASLLGLAATAAPAQTLSVRTADLDLSTAAGVKALDLRILHAASALCGTPSPSDIAGRAKLDDCRAQVRTSAEAARTRAIADASTTRVATR